MGDEFQTMDQVAVVRVFSKRKPDAVRFRVDRRTPLGNPYPLEDEDDREVVVDRYREHLRRRLDDHERDPNPTGEAFDRILEAVRRGDRVELACWCSPKLCHGDAIRDELEARLSYKGPVT